MPILDYGKRPDNWVLVTSLSKGEIFTFRQYIFEAKKRFKYSGDKKFLKTLLPNEDFKKPYIYRFDASINKTIDDQYILKIQDLLNTANEYMDKQKMDNKKIYGQYKLDIMGTWNCGYIVLMKRSNTQPNNRNELARQATIKRYQDIGLLSDTPFVNNLGKGLF